MNSSGFRRYTRDQIQVNVDTVARVDVAMQLGNVEQTVEVVGDAPVLQTETASVGSVAHACGGETSAQRPQRAEPGGPGSRRGAAG